MLHCLLSVVENALVIQIFSPQVGIMHIQLLHTSASLTINENWDPDVRDDMEMMLNRWEIENGKCCWEETKSGWEDGRPRDPLTTVLFSPPSFPSR